MAKVFLNTYENVHNDFKNGPTGGFVDKTRALPISDCVKVKIHPWLLNAIEGHS